MEQESQKKTIRIKFMDGCPADAYVKPFYRELSRFYNVEYSDQPDYVIFGVFGEEHLAYNNCVKICYAGECIVPDFNLCDYAMGNHYISFGDRYFRYPVWYIYNRESTLLMQKKHEDVEGILSRKTDFCSFVVSNGGADPIRQAAFEALSAYKRVNSGGRFLNNIGQPEGVADKLEFDKKHKFSLAFENQSHPGYVSEKLIDAFAAQTVPIYWGDPTVAEAFNPKAFINVHDFESLESLVDYVKKVDEDDELYMEMLRQPALLNRSDYLDEKQLALEAFLRNIFDQDREKAFRRSMRHWEARYQEYRLKTWKQTRIFRRIDRFRRRIDKFCRAIFLVIRKLIVAVVGEETYCNMRDKVKKLRRMA